ncbi:hypothetical protein CMV_008995 [Castanea mollissima]|uniref:Uncharacterized protein n=1 Tax=Castanea mollissima TaxID=60419 RepID=A0A8J4R7R0_9ROSI|nr:hypothetical protein CMV_008995 [Castanea mollissima]
MSLKSIKSIASVCGVLCLFADISARAVNIVSLVVVVPNCYFILRTLQSEKVHWDSLIGVLGSIGTKGERGLAKECGILGFVFWEATTSFGVSSHSSEKGC